MKTEKVNTNWYGTSFTWRGERKSFRAASRSLVSQLAKDAMAVLVRKDEAYQERRKKLSTEFFDDGAGYYLEDAKLKQELGIPLDNDNLQALEWEKRWIAELNDKPSFEEAVF